MKGKYRKGIFFVVFARERKILYLILKRKLHWRGWEFPKGGIEKNETAVEAMKRELKEETGLQAKKIINLKLEGKFDYPHELNDRKGTKGMKWKLFAVEAKFGRARIDKKEHSACKWVEFKEAFRLLKHNNQKTCLKIVNKSI